MVTPYLKPFNVEGGTLYVFPSVSKELTRTFVSSDYEGWIYLNNFTDKNGDITKYKGGRTEDIDAAFAGISGDADDVCVCDPGSTDEGRSVE